MPRIQVTQNTVLAAVVARLRTVLSLPDNRCFETTNPLSAVPTTRPAHWFVTVCAGDGIFDEGMQDGGGQEQLMEDAETIVTVYSPIKLDRVDHDHALLQDESRGLLELKRLVLATLVNHDLENDDGDTFLRQLIPAKHATKPEYDPDKGIGWLSIAFRTSFDWELS